MSHQNLIPCPIAYFAKKTPNRPAIITKEKIYSYEDLHKALNCFTQEHTGILYPKWDIETIVTIWALFRRKQLIYLLRPDSIFPSSPLQKNTSSLFFEENQKATVIFTSGSTGKPKGAIHTFGNHFYSALGVIMSLPFSSKDRWMLRLPLYHVSGLSILFRCFFRGAAVVLPSEDYLEDLFQFNITHLSAVPTQLFRLSTLPKKTLQKLCNILKVVLVGGNALSEALYETLSLPLYLSYGMTEMSSTITINPPKSFFSQGFSLPFRELKIGEDGEILVKGKTRFLGYLGEKPLDGWFHTRDLGSLDPIKGLSIFGRKDRMFISGGENIYPEEIERALLKNPLISNVKVVSIDHAEFGKRPIAFICVKKPLDPKTIRKELGNYLPKFKIPDEIIFSESLPNLKE